MSSNVHVRNEKWSRSSTRALAYSRPEAQAFRWKVSSWCDVGVSLFDIGMVQKLDSIFLSRSLHFSGGHMLCAFHYYDSDQFHRPVNCFVHCFHIFANQFEAIFFLCLTFDIFFHFFGCGHLSAHILILFFPTGTEMIMDLRFATGRGAHKWSNV